MADLPPMTAAEFAAALNVSRETLQRLQTYITLLHRWQPKINLVGRATLDDVWRRHILDSGQLCQLMPDAKSIADIGSGAGFPGLVVAIMSGAHVTLIESNQRKATFLREVARATSASATVVVGRAEKLPAAPAQAVTARAVAPLSRLLVFAEPWLCPGGRCFFLKGDTVKEELTNAGKIWDIKYELVPSLSDPTGKILCIKEFRRV